MPPFWSKSTPTVVAFLERVSTSRGAQRLVCCCCCTRAGRYCSISCCHITQHDEDAAVASPARGTASDAASIPQPRQLAVLSMIVLAGLNRTPWYIAANAPSLHGRDGLRCGWSRSTERHALLFSPYHHLLFPFVSNQLIGT